MTDKEEKKAVNSSAVVAGTVGAIAGAVVGAVVTGVLSDKKKQQKIKKVLTDSKDTAVKFIAEVKNQIEDEQQKVKKKLTAS